jgi:hypothetical protein
VPELIGALRDRDAYVRSSAARSLGEIGPDAKIAITALTGALDDRDQFVRTSATEALRRIRGGDAGAAAVAAGAVGAASATRTRGAQNIVAFAANLPLANVTSNPTPGFWRRFFAPYIAIGKFYTPIAREEYDNLSNIQKLGRIVTLRSIPDGVREGWRRLFG